MNFPFPITYQTSNIHSLFQDPVESQRAINRMERSLSALLFDKLERKALPASKEAVVADDFSYIVATSYSAKLLGVDLDTDKAVSADIIHRDPFDGEIKKALSDRKGRLCQGGNLSCLKRHCQATQPGRDKPTSGPIGEPGSVRRSLRWMGQYVDRR